MPSRFLNAPLKRAGGNSAALWGSGILVGLQFLFTYTAPLLQIFHTMQLDYASWLLTLALAMFIFLAVEVEKWLLRRLGIHRK